MRLQKWFMRGGTRFGVITFNVRGRGMLNKITLWFLNRAFAQMESAGALQNAHHVAEFIEDYFDEMVK